MGIDWKITGPATFTLWEGIEIRAMIRPVNLGGRRLHRIITQNGYRATYLGGRMYNQAFADAEAMLAQLPSTRTGS